MVEKRAYCTLLSTIDFLPSIIVLNNSLKRTKTLYPLIVMVTNDIADTISPILQKLQIQGIIIPSVQYPNNTPVPNRLKTVGAKLYMFALKNYDRVIYIDGDTIILKNIDKLFNYPDGSMIVNCDCSDFSGLAGLLVYCPKNHNLDNYLCILHTFGGYWESDVLAQLWFPIKDNSNYRIPDSYSFGYNLNWEKEKINKFYAVNFCGDYKPWYYDSVEDFYLAFSSPDNIHNWLPCEKKEKFIKKYFNEYKQAKTLCLENNIKI